MPQAEAMTVIDHPTADILAVAAKCFRERGYGATSIDEVARGVGATKGRVYYHFKSKSDLFAAVFRSGMTMLSDAIDPVCRLDLPAAEKLRRMATTHVGTVIRTQAFQRVVWEGVEMHRRGATTPDQRMALDELANQRHDYGELFRPVMEQARRNGVLDYPNPSVALQLMLMTLNTPIIWYSPRAGETENDRENLIAQVVDYAMSGLGEGRVKRP